MQGGSGVCPGEAVLVRQLVSEQLLLSSPSRSPPASLAHAVRSAPHCQAAAALTPRFVLLLSPCRVWWTSCCPRWTSGSATCCACATACWGEQTAGVESRVQWLAELCVGSAGGAGMFSQCAGLVS